MELDRELRRIADAAVRHAADGEELAGIVPAEPGSGVRVYVCAFSDGDETSWLVLDANGSPVADRSLVREASRGLLTSRRWPSPRRRRTISTR